MIIANLFDTMTSSTPTGDVLTKKNLSKVRIFTLVGTYSGEDGDGLSVVNRPQI